MTTKTRTAGPWWHSPSSCVEKLSSIQSTSSHPVYSLLFLTSASSISQLMPEWYVYLPLNYSLFLVRNISTLRLVHSTQSLLSIIDTLIDWQSTHCLPQRLRLLSPSWCQNIPFNSAFIVKNPFYFKTRMFLLVAFAKWYIQFLNPTLKNLCLRILSGEAKWKFLAFHLPADAIGRNYKHFLSFRFCSREDFWITIYTQSQEEYLFLFKESMWRYPERFDRLISQLMLERLVTPFPLAVCLCWIDF